MLVMEKVAGTQSEPLYWSTWFKVGAVDVTEVPWIRATVCERAVPPKSPPGAKQPTHDPTMETFPGNVVVAPLLPIMIAVAEDVPMETVPVASITLFESPEMLVPLKVNAAVAIDAPAKRAKAQTHAPTMKDHRNTPGEVFMKRCKS
jgi:hypothetical protein